MAKFYSQLEPKLIEFIAAQHIFFTATTPESGRINLSPKGMDSFRVVSATEVAYLDLTGSGNETAAHLKQNGRMTIMFCSFDADPLILRLYGQGYNIRPRDENWSRYRSLFPALPGERQITVLTIETAQSSCGYAVPLYDYKGERETLARWANKKGPVGLLAYWREKNRISIDGIDSGLIEQK